MYAFIVAAVLLFKLMFNDIASLCKKQLKFEFNLRWYMDNLAP